VCLLLRYAFYHSIAYGERQENRVVKTDEKTGKPLTETGLQLIIEISYITNRKRRELL